jgi:hypothetical protein
LLTAPHAVNWLGVVPFAIALGLFLIALKTGKLQGALPIGRFDRAKNAPDYWAVMFVALLFVIGCAAFAFMSVKCAIPNFCTGA